MATTEEKMLEEAYSVTPNFEVDPNDPRLGKVESAGSDAIKENDKLYAGMINKADAFYDKQIQLSQDWADKQTELQNQRTDFAIEQIEQQEEQAHKDYLKEQSGAYVDWQKQSNQYGTEAERMASAGLTSTGYAESSQVSMYNTYQNRVATAREVFGRAVLNYDNAMKDAMLQNNAALAEIAYNALQKQLELSLEGFQYKNQLVLDQANKKLEIDNMYWNRYQDVLDQINAENSIKADIWKYQDSQKWQADENEKDRTHSEKLKNIELDYNKERDRLNREHDFALLKAKTAAEKEKADHDHKLAMDELDKKLANDKALASYEYELEKKNNSAPITGGGNNKRVVTANAPRFAAWAITNTPKTPTGFTGSTLEEAQAYLKNKGVPGTQRAGLLTASEWSRKRASYTTYGTGNDDVKNFSSYGAYLQAKVNYYEKNYGK